MRIIQRRRIRRALALLLALAVCAALLPVLALAVDLTQPCSIRVSPGIEDEAVLADLQQAHVVADLYRVADAVSETEDSNISFHFTGDYAALELQEGMDADAWQALAQQAARIAREKGEPVLRGVELGTETELQPGLYLLIARGAELADYWSESADDGLLSTLARSATYEYAFLPQFAVVPSRDTEGSGDWEYQIDIALKASYDRRPGSFEIVKSVSGLTGPDPALFVFHWYAYDENGVLLCDDVATIVFTSAGESRLRIDGIPAGARVVVHEEQNRLYDLISQNDVTVEASTEDIQAAEFYNQPNDNPGGGFGVNNHFEYVEYDDGRQSEWLWMPGANKN